MAVTYIGNCEFPKLGSPNVGPGQWRVNALGTDSYIEQYRGRADRLDIFLSMLEVGSQATGKCAFLDSWSNDQNPVFPTVTLEYIGFKSGSPRGPFYRPGVSVGSASASTQISSGQATISVQYYAPSGEYEWWELSKPSDDQPKYSGVRSNLSPLASIFQWRITGGGKNGAMSLNNFTSVLNALSQSSFVQGYTSEEVVPNHIWHCKSTSVRTMV
jgi:hypothetical protein